jgi:hypothetical protein
VNEELGCSISPFDSDSEVMKGVPKRIARPVHENRFDKFRRSIDNNFSVFSG